MKKIILFITTTCLFVSLSLFANDKHQLDNYHVTIDATAHKNARFIDTKRNGNKEYIHGKGTSYNKKGEAVTGKALW
ncbi:MAG: hypothetical protein RR346_11460, partial [Bacteroidales bacterium]